MAALEKMRAAALSARNVLRLGPVVPGKLRSPVSNASMQDYEDDLYHSFRHLTLSPTEAKLSSHFLTSATVGSFANNTELRLPPLLKPPTVTIPTLYNGDVLEKDLPSLLNILEIKDPIGPHQYIETPSNQVVEKQAIRMIVTRRRKMKRHKLKKLRKKMKFEWGRRRQRRELKKEKLFQAEQMAKVREMEGFDAVQYVEKILQTTKEKPLPELWKGTRVPEPIMKQLMEEDRIKKMRKKKFKLEMDELKKIIDTYKPRFPPNN